ncbi:ribosomal-processing cysteine protease Prp [Caldalkalibacillus mannanilyticus]|uniref:ribosomal-processing cysteine protease Prp n=1 Tax=Caldalkalibacillus mannanilyticus TaxID=1418 RepID=UPI0004680E99|nr:ribosomal-processing cysteine protease Prp [Caldalkalibacillus mannanilyticus]
MIKITIKRQPDSREILQFTLHGHAGYADSGQDIVCSAVTAVSFGTVNSIETLLDTKLQIEMEQKTGFLHCIVPTSRDEATHDEATHEKVQLLLESMVLTLESIASEYGKYINIIFE